MTEVPVPATVARALRQLESHRAVRSVSAPASRGSAVEVVINFDAGLGNRWRAGGHSESGVLAVEPLTFLFRATYPLDAPDIFLRPDFDRSHPHLQPSGSAVPPMPCYVDGHPRELLRLRGITGIADQLASWLSKAADFSLIDFEQGWEPVRRDHIDDIIVVDAAELRALASKAEDAVFIDGLCRIDEPKGVLPYYAMWLPSAGRIAFSSKHFSKLAARTSIPAITVVAWSGKRPDGSVFLADRYRPETVSTLKELLSRADELGSGGALRSKLALIRGIIGPGRLARPFVVGVILLARRPCNLVGLTSPIELCPYLILIRYGDDLRVDNQPVRLAMQRDRITPSLMRRASGLPASDVQPNWALLGAGSLGSKIAVHLARQASGPSAVVDRACMLPHNFARHALIPFNNHELVEPTKAEHLLDTLSRLGTVAAQGSFDIARCCLGGNAALLQDLWGGRDFVLDTTGSPTVTEALCAPTVPNRPPAVEASLMAGGRIAYVAIEGTDRNPTLLDLQAEGYRLMADEPGLMATVFSTKGQSIMLGQGCSSVTSPMTDAMLSAAAAPIAALVARVVDEGIKGPGEIHLGRIAADCMGQIWSKELVEPFTVVEGGPAHPAVRLSKRVLAMIDEDIATHPGTETGGVIVGRFSEVANAFTVVDLIPAPPDSAYKPAEFKLGIEGLGEAIGDLVAKTSGAIYPLGTWHNHLDESGPSRTDIGTGALIAAGQNFPALLLIRTPKGFRTLWAEAVDARLAVAG